MRGRLLAAATLASLTAAATAAAPPLSVAPAALAAQGRAVSASPRLVVLEGEIQVEVADFTDLTSATYHFLKTPAGERHPLRFKDDRRRRLQSGARVRVKGILADNILTAEASPEPLEPAAAELAPALPYAVGVQKTAVILVNFQDKATTPQTAAAVNSLVFGQVNSFFMENSTQAASVNGNVLGWYTLPLSSTSCNISGIRTYARSAAAAAGADLSAYSRFVYIFPNTSACSWAGYATIGGSPTDAWINGYFDRRVIAHELGHNLGLHHAHSLECGSATIGSSCSTSEYGDLIDTMGWGLYGHFSAYQKEALGWLGFGGMPAMATVQSSGSYALASYASGTGSPRALKVLKDTDPATGRKTWYYLEYRQPTGFDNVLSGTGNLTAGVTVRIGNAIEGARLLDMTPGSNTTSEYNGLKDAALTVGRSFSDTAAGVSFTVTRADAAGATVDVSLANVAAPCIQARPSVLVSPLEGTTVAAGTAQSYTVAVTNNDSAACPASTISLARSLPAGWMGSLGKASLAIGPGTAASTTLAMASSPNALPGTYTVGVSATASPSGLSGSGTGTYVIGTPVASTLSETVVPGQWAYLRGATVSATVTVRNSGIPVPNAALTFRMTKANGDLVYSTGTTGATGQFIFQYPSSAADPLGAYRIGATAASGGMTVYSSGSFTLQ